MGDDRRTSVLNRYNQAHDVENLFVTDGACFVSNACVNPTLAVMAITVRACDYITKDTQETGMSPPRREFQREPTTA